MWGKSILTMGSAMDLSSNSILNLNKSSDSTENNDEITVELQYTKSTAGSSTNAIQTIDIKIPIHSILLTEIEMQETSAKFSIYKDQWSGSLFYRKWEENGNQFSINLDDECIALKKDADGKPSKLTNTCLFTKNCIWDEWCVDLIKKFYSSGKLNITSNVQGYDFLLLIEVFGILYQPHQLVYESYSAYINVRHWSNYFTHRIAMSCWIADYIDRYEKEKKSKVVQTTRFEFATSLTPDSVIVSLEDVLLPVIGQSDQEQSKSSSRVTVHDYDYFNGVSNTANVGSISIDTANLMQKDFVLFLEHYLCNIIQNAKFVPSEVTIRTAENVAAVTTRAILVVEILTSSFKLNQKETEESAVHEIVTEILVVDPITDNNSESHEHPPPITMMTIQGLSQGENDEIETIACMSQTMSKKMATTYNEKQLSQSNDVESQHSPRGISDFDLFQAVPMPLKVDDDELNVEDEEGDIKITSIPTVEENDKSDLSKNDASSTRKVVFEVSQDLLSTVVPGDSEMSPLDVLDGKQFDLVTVPSALTTSFTVYDTDNNYLRTSARENPGMKPALTDFVRSLFKQEKNIVSEQRCSDQVGRWDWLVDMNACQFPQKLLENMQRCSVANNTSVRNSNEAKNEISSAKLDVPMPKDIDNLCQMDEFVSIDVVHVDGLPSDEARTQISVTETHPEINQKQVKNIPTIKQHLQSVQNKINEGKLHFVRSATH